MVLCLLASSCIIGLIQLGFDIFLHGELLGSHRGAFPMILDGHGLQAALRLSVRHGSNIGSPDSLLGWVCRDGRGPCCVSLGSTTF